MRFHRCLTWLVPLIAFFALMAASGSQAGADGKLPARELLYPKTLEETPPSLKPFVTKLLAADQSPVQAGDVKPTGVFVRVVTKKHILENGALKKGGYLGSKPFVFVTLPEALFGQSLFQIFSAIGYSADEVLTGQLGEEKVALVFRWDEQVVVHPGRDGVLPEAWQSAIYPTNWDNLFALVDKMASEKDWHYVKQADTPAQFSKLELRSSKERHFLLGYPDAGKQRIKSTSYALLEATRGADWTYRQLLERSMSAAEHFSGDGTTKPTFIAQGRSSTGFPEFLGPNRELTALPEVAVIGLGALQVGVK